MAVKKEADQNSALIVETKRIKKGGLFKQILSTVLSGLLVIIFVLLTELFQSVFFLYSVSEELEFQPILGFDENTLREFFGTIYPLLICSFFILFLIFLFIIKCKKRLEEMFFCIGLVISGFLNIAISLFCINIINSSPNFIHDTIIVAADIIKEFLVIFALAGFIVATLFISIFRIIKIVKRRCSRE